ncbi:MAG: hypothetical protein ACK5PB_16335 [Pirellula sp.]
MAPVTLSIFFVLSRVIKLTKIPARLFQELNGKFGHVHISCRSVSSGDICLKCLALVDLMNEILRWFSFDTMKLHLIPSREFEIGEVLGDVLNIPNSRSSAIWWFRFRRLEVLVKQNASIPQSSN